MTPPLTRQQLEEKVRSFRFWYHKIDLGQGVVTPGLDFEPVWDMIRRSRSYIDYRGKSVLDLASFDGMWSFEAEKLGASLVVVSDCYFDTYRNFLFCRDVLGSQVLPYYNVSPYDLWNRLDVLLQENWREQKPFDRLFDIVHHTGLLYHLRDPLMTLSQARSVMKTGGLLLMETAVVVDHDKSYMVFNGVPPKASRIYEDLTTWWAPSVPCLKEMLQASLFEPVEGTMQILNYEGMTGAIKASLKRLVSPTGVAVSRASLVARAVSPDSADPEYVRELMRTYRNPGFAPLGRPW